MIAPCSSRNSSKESFGLNDMAYNYYPEEAKKKTQDKNMNLKPREMPSARTHHTPNACTPKLRSNNQMSKNWPASKSCDETLKVVHKVDHSRNPSSLSDSKHFVCSTCQKCVCNANHDVCVTNFLKEVNSRAKVQSHKNSNKPVKPKSHTQKPGRQIAIGQRFSLNKSSAVHEKPNTPRSCLRWKPTGRIFKTVSLRWIPTGKMFIDSTTKVDDCIIKILNKVNSRAKVQSPKIRNNNPVEPKNHTHDDCIIKILNKVNSRAKVQSPKIRNNNPVEPKNHKTDISYIRSSRNSNLMNMLQKMFGQNCSGLVLLLDDV
ncbi:hypothetical protein Tco_1085260 [Tanacetum coccineum]